MFLSSNPSFLWLYEANETGFGQIGQEANFLAACSEGKPLMVDDNFRSSIEAMLQADREMSAAVKLFKQSNEPRGVYVGNNKKVNSADDFEPEDEPFLNHVATARAALQDSIEKMKLVKNAGRLNANAVNMLYQLDKTFAENRHTHITEKIKERTQEITSQPKGANPNYLTRVRPEVLQIATYLKGQFPGFDDAKYDAAASTVLGMAKGKAPGLQ